MKRIALIGRSLRHSYSPQIHAALTDKYSYELLEILPEDVEDVLRDEQYAGFNVTIPYKVDALMYCDELSEVAQVIGSVNTVVRRPDGTLYGDNTDAAGFAAMLASSGLKVRGEKVIILGSGGSSRAVRYVLEQAGVRETVLVSRNGRNALDVTKPINNPPRHSANYKGLDRHSDAVMIVNTTPVGMFPHTGFAPVNLKKTFFDAGVSNIKGVLDLIYNPSRTRLLIEAAQLGLTAVGGLIMLVEQARAAAEQFADAPLTAEVLPLIQQTRENIILVGMPGVGKSSIGQSLARQLNRRFVDTDYLIKKDTGKEITDLFAEEGEVAFRRRESEMTASVGKQSGLVVATGGGVVTRPHNYNHLHQNGTIFWLQRPIEKLETKNRPLSQGDLQALYNAREPLYTQFADHVVIGSARVRDTAERIAHAWQSQDWGDLTNPQHAEAANEENIGS